MVFIASKSKNTSPGFITHNPKYKSKVNGVTRSSKEDIQRKGWMQLSKNLGKREKVDGYIDLSQELLDKGNQTQGYHKRSHKRKLNFK